MKTINETKPTTKSILDEAILKHASQFNSTQTQELLKNALKYVSSDLNTLMIAQDLGIDTNALFNREVK